MKLIKRWWAWQKKFLKGLWLVVTSMGNWKGVTSLIIQNTWLVGVGRRLSNIIVSNPWSGVLLVSTK